MVLPWQRFCQGALDQNFQFFVKKWPFLAQNLFISNFLAQIRSQCLQIDPCAKFQPDWTKDKGARISTWNDTENCLMTSYLLHSDDVSKIPMSWSTIMLSLVLIGPQLTEKQRGTFRGINTFKFNFFYRIDGVTFHQ